MKKLICLFLSLMMVLSMAACGSTQEASTGYTDEEWLEEELEAFEEYVLMDNEYVKITVTGCYPNYLNYDEMPDSQKDSIDTTRIFASLFNVTVENKTDAAIILEATDVMVNGKACANWYFGMQVDAGETMDDTFDIPDADLNILEIEKADVKTVEFVLHVDDYNAEEDSSMLELVRETVTLHE